MTTKATFQTTLLLIIFTLASPGKTWGANLSVRAGEYIVSTIPGVSEKALRDSLAKLLRGGSESIGKIEALPGNLYHVSLAGDVVEKTLQGPEMQLAASEMALSSVVDFIVPNTEFEIVTPVAELAGTGGAGSQIPIDGHLSQIGAGEPLKKGEPVVVALIDSGVDIKHPALGSSILGGADAASCTLDIYHKIIKSSCEGNVEPRTIDGIQEVHGTHVAGLIAAMKNPLLPSFHGVAANAKILVVRATSENGRLPIGNLLKALEYASESGARIVNMSFESRDQPLSFVEDFITRHLHDMLFVVAAGNGESKGGQRLGFDLDKNLCSASPRCEVYPAIWSRNHPNVIAVGAVDANNLVASYSNYGQKTVSIFAPGDQIWSTFPSVLGDPSPQYGWMSGTSQSAPQVSGAAAMILGQWPKLDAVQVAQIILSQSKADDKLEGISSSGGTLDISSIVDIVLPDASVHVPTSKVESGGFGSARPLGSNTFSFKNKVPIDFSEVSVTKSPEVDLSIVSNSSLSAEQLTRSLSNVPGITRAEVEPLATVPNVFTATVSSDLSISELRKRITVDARILRIERSASFSLDGDLR